MGLSERARILPQHARSVRRKASLPNGNSYTIAEVLRLQCTTNHQPASSTVTSPTPSANLKTPPSPSQIPPTIKRPKILASVWIVRQRCRLAQTARGIDGCTASRAVCQDPEVSVEERLRDVGGAVGFEGAGIVAGVEIADFAVWRGGVWLVEGGFEVMMVWGGSGGDVVCARGCLWGSERMGKGVLDMALGCVRTLSGEPKAY